MKSFLTFLMVCCLGLVGAQNLIVPLKVSGKVFLGEEDQPARSVPVNFYTESGRTSVLTNMEGFYAAALDVKVEPGAPYAKVTMVVDNFCNNIPIQKILYVNRDSSVFKDVNFRICETSNPPPPREECKAFFSHKVDPAAPKTVYFQDLSVRPTFIFEWKWNFGDSTTSNLQNPVHTYATSGIYTVSLTILSEATDTVCTSSFRTSVYVRDTADCNCTREYRPVCVTSPNGATITFPNKCVALCAGYSEFQIGACQDTTCVCPAIYNPVCVKLENGTIKEYGNSCEAACAGFTERDFVECQRDPCDCPTDEYAPVCVVVNGDTLTYGNICRAKCAGFEESDFVECRENEGCNCDLEYAPVCVISENGDTLTFSNKCFAYCKGYEAQDLFYCNQNDCICPAIYDPVCVKLENGTIKEYGNSCEAACAGFTERDFVECQRDPCDCPTDEYAPVCVVVNGDTLTYGNICRAKCAGFEESDFVECRENEGCNCDLEYAPVCVISENGDTLTFSNKCFAYCKGYEAQDIFYCNQNECICPAVYDPVCVKLENGTIKEFGNFCEAKCAGYKERDLVPCDTTGCNCPKILDPICAVGPNGDTLTFTNKCFAVCEGYTPEQLFQCRPNACLCPPVIDPVCVKLADGNIIKYNSKCEAICNGFDESDIVRCDSNSCVCPEYYDPVCVVVNGDTLTFDNPCFARCKGFGERDWFRCRRDDDDDCACPLNLDPVCVKIDGAIKEFPNACVARCYGFTQQDFVPCVRDTSDCFCPLYFDPVCAIGPNGDTITFSNKCFAACKGYDGNDLFRCEREDDPNEDCTASFNPILRDSSLTVDFKDSSKVLQGTILGWKWEFGDGTFGDSQNPTHTYARPGVYRVTQYIATSTGCTSSTTQVVYVGRGDDNPRPRCQAMFTFAQNPNSLNTIEFKNLSFGNISSILWEFGDGYTSSEKNPTHTYSSNGVFYVRLTVRSENCESTTSMIVFIDPNAFYDNECNALFLPMLFVDSLQVAFLNLSSTDATTFKWNFGDSTTSAEARPLHTYRTQGIYEVTLTITTANGCTSTFRSTINLNTQNFTGNPAYRTATVTTNADEVEAIRNFKLYPNPAKEELTLEFNAPTSGNYQVQIFSLEGKLMQTNRESVTSGSNRTPLNISNLPSGMYLLRIQTDGQTKSAKFIKQ